MDFLSNKQGYCEQYASAMAVMLRAVGVPARVAIGFTQGTQDADGSYVINSNDAHAWVEVLFDKAGWVQFDPTPLAGGQGGQQGFTEGSAAAPTTGAQPTSRSPLRAVRGTDEPTARDGAAISPPPEDARRIGRSTTSPPSRPAVGCWFILLVVLVAAAWPGPPWCATAGGRTGWVWQTPGVRVRRGRGLAGDRRSGD